MKKLRAQMPIVLLACCMGGNLIAEEEIKTPLDPQQIRRLNAECIRFTAAEDQFATTPSSQPNNGDEALYNDRRGNFAKGLRHSANGIVDNVAYTSLLTALNSKRPVDFNNILLGGAQKLIDPQAGLSYSLEGLDAAIFTMPPPPTFASAQTAGEMVELYWQALLRDVPFNQYREHFLAAQACADLNALSDFHGAKQHGSVTPHTLFKIDLPGVLKGPYISQFLYLPIPNFGNNPIEQTKLVPRPGSQNDFLTTFNEWFLVNNGGTSTRSIHYSDEPKFIRNGRDLGDWVHLDYPGQAFFQAALILLGFGPAALDDNHPYKANAKQSPYVSYGITDLLNLVTATSQSVMKAVWYNKWFIHRRARPEEFGFRVHKQLTSNGTINYGIHTDLLNSQAIINIFEKYGSYFLPQQYTEGCPKHPAYPCGHGTIGAACVTLLKAWFNEDFIIPFPVKPNNNNTALVSTDDTLTIEGELNKLFCNIAVGRHFAGVHWLSDCMNALELGEAIAIAILEDEAYTKNINCAGFSLTKFNGQKITVGAKKPNPTCVG